MGLQTSMYVIASCGVVGLLFAWIRSKWVVSQDAGDDTMNTIAGHIRSGAMAFLGREYRVLVIFVILAAVLLGWANANKPES